MRVHRSKLTVLCIAAAASSVLSACDASPTRVDAPGGAFSLEMPSGWTSDVHPSDGITTMILSPSVPVDPERPPNLTIEWSVSNGFLGDEHVIRRPTIDVAGTRLASVVMALHRGNPSAVDLAADLTRPGSPAVHYAINCLERAAHPEDEATCLSILGSWRWGG